MEKIHAHKIVSCHFLRVRFKIYNEHPPASYNNGVPLLENVLTKGCFY